jgi:hypothetical protein
LVNDGVTRFSPPQQTRRADIDDFIPDRETACALLGAPWLLKRQARELAFARSEIPATLDSESSD